MRRRGSAVTALLLLLLGVGTATTPAAARWGDTGTVVASASSADVLLPPSGTTCTSGLTTATISWPQTDVRYRFSVTLWRSGTPRTLVQGPTQLGAGQTSVSYSGILNLGTQYEVDVRSTIAGSLWVSATARTSQRFTVGVLGGCG